MRDVDDWLKSLVGKTDVRSDCQELDRLAQDAANTPALLSLHERLLEGSERTNAARWCAEHIEELFSLRPSAAHAKALVVVLGRLGKAWRRSAALLDRAAQAYAWHDLRAAIVSSVFPGRERALASLAASYALRSRSISDDAAVLEAWFQLGDIDDEAQISWMDPSLLDWLSSVAPAMYGAGLTAGPGAPRFASPQPPRPPGGSCPAPEPLAGLRFATSILQRSNGQVEAVAWPCAEARWPARVADFPPLGEAAANPMPLAGIGADEFFAALAHVAVHGGAYDDGQGALAGAHAVWLDLRTLLALPPGTKSLEVAAALCECTCVAYPVEDRWFAQVAWDGFVGIHCPRTRRSALVAWTDTD